MPSGIGLLPVTGYRDDGDAGLLHVGARYYDPQVGRFISRDAVLSEHPYLYCEHEPVNSVDPSGYLPSWQEVKDWLKENGRAIYKGAVAFLGVVTGVKLAEEIYIVYVDWDCSNRMNDMIRRWSPKGLQNVDWDLINRLRNQHIRDAMRDIGRAAGEVAKTISNVRPSQ